MMFNVQLVCSMQWRNTKRFNDAVRSHEKIDANFNVLQQFIYTHYLSRNIMILIKRTKMRKTVRLSDKWNSLLPREKRKSSLPQCSCTRHVYWLGTHKERHFVLVLFFFCVRSSHATGWGRRRGRGRVTDCVVASLVYFTA